MIIMGFKLKKGELINYLLVCAVSILIFWLLQSSVLLINPCSIKSSIQSLSPLKLIWKFSIRILNPHYTQSSHLRLCTCKYLSDCHQDCTISIVYLWLIKSFKAERWRVSCPGSSYTSFWRLLGYVNHATLSLSMMWWAYVYISVLS